MLTRMVCSKCGSPFDGIKTEGFSVCGDCEKDKKNPFRIFVEQRRVLRLFIQAQVMRECLPYR